MLKEILAAINWIDVLAACIFLRCIYVGAKNGLVVEAFKFFGMIFATFVTLHYYVQFSKLLKHHIVASPIVHEFLAFVLLWGGCLAIFKIMCGGYILVSKAEGITPIAKTGSMLLAFFRAALVCGLTFILIYILGSEYLTKTTKTSKTGTPFINLSTNIYRVSYNGFISKLFPGEVKNFKVLTLSGQGKAKK